MLRPRAGARSCGEAVRDMTFLVFLAVHKERPCLVHTCDGERLALPDDGTRACLRRTDCAGLIHRSGFCFVTLRCFTGVKRVYLTCPSVCFLDPLFFVVLLSRANEASGDVLGGLQKTEALSSALEKKTRQLAAATEDLEVCFLRLCCVGVAVWLCVFRVSAFSVCHATFGLLVPGVQFSRPNSC